MELASSQGDHVAQTAQVQESDFTRGAKGGKISHLEVNRKLMW